MRAKVLIIGGDDVHARIDLMRGLANDFALAAAGTNARLHDDFERAGFPYLHYPLVRGVGPLSDVYAFAALWRLIAAYRPDIVHAFDTKPGVYGCLAARCTGVPVVIGTVTGLGSLYGDDAGRMSVVRGVYEGLQRLASRCSDLTIFQNRQDREEFVARRVVSASKATVIAGSGVATDAFDPASVNVDARQQVRASLGLPLDGVVVTLVSRVMRSKGVEEFVAAAQHVRAVEPNVRFLLVGPADEESVDRFTPAEIERFRQVVHWPGPRKDIAHVLAATDVFVLPSYLREGIPRVLLEAASMGLPLVTTDTPGCNDVVADGVNGFLTKPRDPSALSRAILTLVASPELRRAFGAESRRRAVERFDLSVVVAQTRRIYASLLTERAGLRKRPAHASPERVLAPIAG